VSADDGRAVRIGVGEAREHGRHQPEPFARGRVQVVHLGGVVVVRLDRRQARTALALLDQDRVAPRMPDDQSVLYARRRAHRPRV
jgi:hypothetical protein